MNMNMNTPRNGLVRSASIHNGGHGADDFGADEEIGMRDRSGMFDLHQSLADIKGQAQFLLYLADQIEESLDQLDTEDDACHSAFLCKVLGMYSGQLESKHHGLGEKIAETCQEVYVTVREHDMI
jgi:hypothetical protein